MTVQNVNPRIEPNVDLPWKNSYDWSQVELSLKIVTARIDKSSGIEKADSADKEHDGAETVMSGLEMLAEIRSIAGQIRALFESLAGPIDYICDATCNECGDVCCLKATIWFDFKDLLYLHFCNDGFPEFQIYKKNEQGQKACCHFTQQGCCLPRTKRPFVCTWYFCSVQKDFLTSENNKLQSEIKKTLSVIKELRDKMEELFIKMSVS